jgi:hypothetical protein
MAGQCLFFVAFCYIYRSVSSWDRKHIDRSKEIFWNVIVKAKWGLAGTETTFDFKYVPQYDTLTNLGDIGERKLKTSSIEMRNLRAIGVFAGVVLVGTIVSVKVAASIICRLW